MACKWTLYTNFTSERLKLKMHADLQRNSSLTRPSIGSIFGNILFCQCHVTFIVISPPPTLVLFGYYQSQVHQAWILLWKQTEGTHICTQFHLLIQWFPNCSSIWPLQSSELNQHTNAWMMRLHLDNLLVFSQVSALLIVGRRFVEIQQSF